MYYAFKHIRFDQKKKTQEQATPSQLSAQSTQPNQVNQPKTPTQSKGKLCSHQLSTLQADSTLVPHQDQPGEKSLPIAAERGTESSAKIVQKCPICAKENHDRRMYRWKLILGLLPAITLTSLDLTIIATALPFIASHFDKFNQLNWIVTAFTLTETAFIPTFGQLADILGRHTSLQISVLLNVVGSTLSAASQDWAMLLLGRALQGVGAAGILNVGMIILADGVSLKENAKNTSIFQFVAGISYSIGPIVGGYLTNANWRYCFVILIPIALISNILIYTLMRKHLKKGTYPEHVSSQNGRFQAKAFRLRSLDFGGTLLFIVGVGLILLATAWGGATYAWSSAPVITPLVAGSLLFILFFFYERSLEPGAFLSNRLPHTQAMIPFSLFYRRDVLLMAFINASAGAAMFSVFYFISVYFTLVEAYPASKAGIQLLYYIPGIGIGVYAAMFMCNISPRQTFWPLFIGTVVETLGIAVMTWAISQRRTTLINVMMGFAGAGTGVRMMPSNLHLVGVWPDQIAAVYSILRFILPFGGTIALTLMGAVFTNVLSGVFKDPALEADLHGLTSLHSNFTLQGISSLPAPAQVIIRDAGRKAAMYAFISILPILGLSVLASMALGNVWIVAKKKEGSVETESTGDTPRPENSDDNQSEVIDSIYLLALLRRSVDREKRPSRPLPTDSGLKNRTEDLGGEGGAIMSTQKTLNEPGMS